MIEVSWGIVKSPLFKQAFQKLIHSDHGQKINYHLARVSSLFDVEGKAFDQAFVKLLQKYQAVKDDGSYSPMNVAEEKRAEFMKEFEELHAQKCVINKHKVNVDELKCSLTAAEIMAIEPLIFGLEIIEGGSNGQENKSVETEAQA